MISSIILSIFLNIPPVSDTVDKVIPKITVPVSASAPLTQEQIKQKSIVLHNGD